MFKIKDEQRGAIIIEASIILPIFIFMFMTLYSVLNICFLEVRVQNALNNAARQIGEYSYIYAFTGVKDKADEYTTVAEKNKADMKTEVVDNFATLMGSIENIKDNVDNLENFNMESLKNIQGDAEAGLTAGKALLSKLKEWGSDPKKFFGTALKIFASDVFEEIKHVLASALAEWMCEGYLKDEFIAKIDFDKSLLFPGTSSDIVLVAEYEVRVIPYIPVDIKYTISQQVVTRGWLDGDGKSVDKNKPDKIDPIHEAVKQKNVWTSKGGLTVNERATAIRNDVSEKLRNEEGYYDLRNNYGNHLYNPETNTFVYIGSSNPMYTVKSIDEVDKNAIKEYLLSTAVRIDESIQTETGYKEKNGNNSTTKVVSPYELQKNGTPIKKEFYLVVPEDKGVQELYQQIWNEIPEDKKRGVTINIKAGYGKNYETFGEDDE